MKLPNELGILSLLTTVAIGGYLLFRNRHDNVVPDDSQVDDKGRSSGVPVDKSKVFNEEILKAKYYAFTTVVAYIREEADFNNLIQPTAEEISKEMAKHEKDLEAVNQLRFVTGNVIKGEKAAKQLAQKILKEINDLRKLQAALI